MGKNKKDATSEVAIFMNFDQATTDCKNSSWATKRIANEL